MNTKTPIRRLIILLLLAVFCIQSLISISRQSATFDEVQYFGIGKYLLKTHKWDVMGAILHPPLSYYLNSIPLLSVSQPDNVWHYETGVVRDRAFLGAVDFYRGQGLLSDESNRNDRLLIASRLMTLMLSVLLGWYVYRFSRDLFGERGGIASLVLFAFNPSMLAFSGIIVPDMPLTVFSFIAMYYVWRDLMSPCVTSLLAAGIFLGLALLSKFTAVLFIPLVLFYYLTAVNRGKKNLFPRAAMVSVVSLVVLLLGYGFDLTPYFQGVLFQIEKNQAGHPAFLLGQYSDHGWWYFYPLVFILKTPLALLILFVFALAIVFSKNRLSRKEGIFLTAPIIVMILFFSASGGAIGIRYLLPVYPFMFVISASLYSCGSKLRYYAYALLVWCVAGCLYSAPHYLSYINEIAGRPANGYKYLVDSNLDWGQGLKELKRFMDLNGIKRINLSYFGADDPHRYGINYDWLPSHYLYQPVPEENHAVASDQLIAVSVTNLQGVYLDSRDEFSWLKNHDPVAIIGNSIFIYDLQGGRVFKQL